jgi:hypothetical protein
MVLEGVGVGDNGAKMRITQIYSLTSLKTKLGKKHFWTRGSCWGRITKLWLTTKTWAHKKNSCKFFQLPIKKRLKWIHVSLCLVAPPQGAKRNTTGVTRRVSANLPHHKGPMPAYPMENKMPLIHNVIKW